MALMQAHCKAHKSAAPTSHSSVLCLVGSRVAHSISGAHACLFVSSVVPVMMCDCDQSYARNPKESIASFFQQNGYIEYSALQKLQVGVSPVEGGGEGRGRGTAVCLSPLVLRSVHQRP